MNQDRRIMTFTGKMFDFWHPQSEDICIEDIAHALALTNRFGGHTRAPYSVAEHCVRCSYLNVGDPLLNLMHDAAEAYIGDIPSPQKRCLRFLNASFSAVEDDILYSIFERLNISFPVNFPDGPTKEADMIMLKTEVRDLMPPKWTEIFKDWLEGFEVDTQKIIPWDWNNAEDLYLARFEELTKCPES